MKKNKIKFWVKFHKFYIVWLVFFSKAKVTFDRCNSEGFNCEYFQSWTLTNICSAIKERNQMWSNWFKAFDPPMICPINKVSKFIEPVKRKFHNTTIVAHRQCNLCIDYWFSIFRLINIFINIELKQFAMTVSTTKRSELEGLKPSPQEIFIVHLK